MDTTYSKNRKLKRMFINILSILAILAIAFPVNGSAFAEGDYYLRAFPDQDRVDGSNWPAGDVYLTINSVEFDPVTAGDDGYVEFVLTGYDLERGDILTMSSGAISVTYTVRQLFITDIDLDAQTVSGTVDGQQTVHVWVGEADEYVEATDAGNWMADLSSYKNPVLFQGTCGNAEAWGDPNSSSSTIIDWCVPPPAPWRDEFVTETLDYPWYWINENKDKWNLLENPGFLRIHSSPYATGGENLLLRPVAQGDFSIETRVFFEPDTNFQFAGLVIYQDENNFLQLGRAFCDIEGACVGNGIYFDKILGGNMPDSNFATQIDNPFNAAESYLRLERRGEMVRAFYSHEGITWTEIGTHWIPPEFQVNAVGLTSAQDYFSGSAIPADFNYFEMTEGWGFLPEGFHDYDSGDVPSLACNAGGWAVDPDDRTTDVAVEIDVDGVALPDWVYAGQYREDLDSAGVCDGGNCGFSTSMWGVISSYEPHSIFAYAQDLQSGEWVQLSNSPKDITCRTYDIYAYDPLTGTTKLITTNLPDTDEYDPTWSPNGKKVAHDVVSSDSHRIYVTDVKTGVSTVLHGTEDGGNDAAWSPNGMWIAFDRRWFGEPNIYIVPATGGRRTLVKENAVRADWAPNGKRLVFQDTDGPIRTAPVDGGYRGETFIAANGTDPAWSPDGNWIAYEFGGNIWKQRVNVQGTTFGDPIQVTALVGWSVGAPTWSADGTTIVFNAGVSSDQDLWTVPTAGGEATWLTGAPVYGDYGPENARNSSHIAYASFSPDGQAARTWVAAFTYDAGTWDDGSHTYQFLAEGAPSGDEFSFDVSSDATLYNGLALIRPGTLRAQTPEGCANISALHPDQQTQFHVGWTYDGIYADAQVFFGNLMAQVRWDAETPADMLKHEVFPFTAPVDWFVYTCTFTVP